MWESAVPPSDGAGAVFCLAEYSFPICNQESIHVAYPHRTSAQPGADAARAKAEKLAERLAKEHGVQCEWQGDELTFKRSGVDGRIAVGADKVAVDVKLGLMLSAMSGLLKGEIEKALDKALA